MLTPQLEQELRDEFTRVGARIQSPPEVSARLLGKDYRPQNPPHHRMALVMVVVLAVGGLITLLSALQAGPKSNSLRPGGSEKSSGVVQRFRATLVDALTDYVVEIDFHGNITWVHQGVGRSVSPDGLNEDVVTTHGGELTATVVNYKAKTWSTSSTPLSSPEAQGGPPNPCNGIGFNLLTFADPVVLQHVLTAQQFIRVPGTQSVGGQTTVELESNCDSKPVFAIYLNADTLLPVAMTQVVGDMSPPSFLATFTVLPATSVNLAKLTLQLPPGFTQVPVGG